MKLSYSIFIAFMFYTNICAQSIEENQFTTPLNTGSNMTLGLDLSYLSDLIGATIGAFNSQGICVGLETIESQFFSMALWGDDNGTNEIEGLLTNEIPSFAILTNEGNIISIAQMVGFDGYSTNSLSVSFQVLLSGCTSADYLEYHTQGFIADQDDGSCQTSIYNLNITPEMFNPISQTDNNMIIGMNSQIINLLEGSIMGAFYDLNNDGILECIDTTVIPGLDSEANGFFTLSLWGDDQITDEIDGLITGQTPTFAIKTPLDYVIAFESASDFNGYQVNAFITFTDIIFDLTIYGCTNPNYCNYNPDAEEDDGTCEGLRGCNNEFYVEFDDNASCYLEGSCQVTWAEAYFQLNLDFTTQQLNYEDQINDLVNDYSTMESEYLAQIISLEDSIANYSSPIYIDIIEGWNIIGYTLDQEQDVVTTLSEITEFVLIVKNNNADVYWPEFGFNGIGNFIPGQGYQLKSTNFIDHFSYPKTDGQKIEINPMVPQWVTEMPIEMHPNDIRSLVKVVNILGQEIEPNIQDIGTTMIYLYNDGTVEKKLK